MRSDALNLPSAQGIVQRSECRDTSGDAAHAKGIGSTVVAHVNRVIVRSHGEGMLVGMSPSILGQKRPGGSRIDRAIDAAAAEKHRRRIGRRNLQRLIIPLL